MLRALRIVGGVALIVVGACVSLWLLPDINLLPAFLGVFAGAFAIHAPRMLAPFKQQRDQFREYMEARPDVGEILDRDERAERLELLLYSVSIVPLGGLMIFDMRPPWPIFILLMCPLVAAMFLQVRRKWTKADLQMKAAASASKNPERSLTQQKVFVAAAFAVIGAGVLLTADDPILRNQIVQCCYAAGILMMLGALIWRLVRDQTEKR